MKSRGGSFPAAIKTGSLSRPKRKVSTGSSFSPVAWVTKQIRHCSSSESPSTPRVEEQILDVAEVDDATPVLGNRQYQSANHDPVFRFEAVEGGTYRIRVRETFTVEQVAAPLICIACPSAKAAPDFFLLALTRDRRDNGLVASLWVPYLRKGESMALKVFAVRRDDFDGEISLEVEGLPPGVSCGPTLILADRSVTDLICETARDTAGGTAAIRIVGKTQLGRRPGWA